MKVIIAGYGKTGTKTMVVALSELGYNVYDFLDHFWYHGDKWAKILSSSGGSIEDFKEMYQSVDAVTDAPTFLFWEEILQAFPDAKVILTTRNEDDWYKSYCGQYKAMNGNFTYKLVQLLSPTGWKYFKYFNSLAMNRCGLEMKHPFDFSFVNNGMVLKKAFRQHTQYCLQNCPPDKLLVYDVRQGWEPLCEFLGKEIPDESFPHENVAGSIVDKLMATHPAAIRVQREMKFTITLFSLGLLFGVCKLYKANQGATLRKMCSQLWDFIGVKLFSRFSQSSP
ncbi:uncharacterized protein LOC143446445 [Clavelina lepadiformis]|uniref:uncharacterized protein LOC143446445 n=1 Tax=Clavelina lepadiformis TaxID=159417 RepID=UPI004041041C